MRSCRVVAKRSLRATRRGSCGDHGERKKEDNNEIERADKDDWSEKGGERKDAAREPGELKGGCCGE